MFFSESVSSSTFCVPLFLSEALEFSDGDFCVSTVTALRFATLFFHFYTWYIYFAFVFSLLRFGFVGLLLALFGRVVCDCVCECWCFLVSRVLLRVF